jgi:uncharacterized membrane protein YkoI
MHNKHFRWLILLLISILSPIYIASASNDHVEARQLIANGEILPLESILKNVRQTYPGKILEVELEKEHGKIIYEIEILDNNGTVIEVYIDATTGKLLSTEQEH